MNIRRDNLSQDVILSTVQVPYYDMKIAGVNEIILDKKLEKIMRLIKEYKTQLNENYFK